MAICSAVLGLSADRGEHRVERGEHRLRIDQLLLVSGQTDDQNNFGELKPAALTGFVYIDANNNGLDGLETGISGVSVTLTGTNDLGPIVAITIMTDINGFYSFGNLRPGTYTVTETQPVG